MFRYIDCRISIYSKNDLLYFLLIISVKYQISYYNFLDECGTESKRTRRIWCNNEATLEIVDDFLCGDQRAKPEDHEACQGKPCKVCFI